MRVIKETERVRKKDALNALRARRDFASLMAVAVVVHFLGVIRVRGISFFVLLTVVGNDANLKAAENRLSGVPTFAPLMGVVVDVRLKVAINRPSHQQSFA